MSDDWLMSFDVILLHEDITTAITKGKVFAASDASMLDRKIAGF